MRGQLKHVLMACVGILALLVVFGWSDSLAYVLLPTLPLLAGLYAMHFVKGAAYLWWYRFAVPWTFASMCAVVLTPFAAKSVVATLAALVLSIVTLVILVQKVVIPNYRIARNPAD
jgi:hypothetical protein